MLTIAKTVAHGSFGFNTEIVVRTLVFVKKIHIFTKTNVLTTISVLKPKGPCATAFAMVNMSATQFLFINEGINALFGAVTEWCVQGANHA